MTLAVTLATIAPALERAAIPYMVVGSVAYNAYGEPRATFDIDIVIEPSRDSLLAFLTALPARYYVDHDVALDALARRSMFNVIDADTGWKVDFIVRKDRAFSIEEFARRQRELVDDVAVFVATAEDTIIAKLEWAKLGNSARQLDDVRRLVGVRGDTLDRAYIAHWVGALGLDAQWAAAQRA